MDWAIWSINRIYVNYFALEFPISPLIQSLMLSILTNFKGKQLGRSSTYLILEPHDKKFYVYDCLRGNNRSSQSLLEHILNRILNTLTRLVLFCKAFLFITSKLWKKCLQTSTHLLFYTSFKTHLYCFPSRINKNVTFDEL